MAELIKTSAIKRAGPSIVGIDIDGDRGAWKIHTVQSYTHAFALEAWSVMFALSVARLVIS